MNKPLESNDWQVKCDKATNRLMHLYNTKLWTDCTFLVGYEETETFKAHKFVLAMSSPVFEVMFYGGMPEGAGPIAVTDVHPDIFRKLIEALYSDKLKIESYREASELYYAAKKYMLPQIQKQCLNHMQNKLEPKNACYALEFAIMFEESQLMNAALKTIIRRTKEVLKDNSFEDVSLKVIVKIFSQERLDLDSELDLYHALDRYAKAHGVTVQDIDPMALDAKRARIDENQENIENESELISNSPGQDVKKEPTEEKISIGDIRAALYLIRFRSLSVCEFTRAVSSTALLTDEEALTVLRTLMNNRPRASRTSSKLESIQGIGDIRAALYLIRFRSLSVCEFTRAVSSTALLTDEEALTILRKLMDDEAPYPEGFTTRKDLRVPICEPEIISSPAETQFEAVCVFSVYNFKSRKRAVRSKQFYTNNVGWTVQVVPDQEYRNGLEEKVLGVLVACEGESSEREGWRCAARVTIEVNSLTGRNLQRTFTHTYTRYL